MRGATAFVYFGLLNWAVMTILPVVGWVGDLAAIALWLLSVSLLLSAYSMSESIKHRRGGFVRGR